MQDVIDDLISLFEEARQKNEFEFVLALINYKGIGPQKIMANLHEWFDAIGFYYSLYDAQSGDKKARMGLLLYATFFENSDFYNIIGSLCRIKLGFKGSSYLFWKTRKYERLLGVGEKKDFLTELLMDTGKEKIIAFFEETYFKEIRNAFFHSAYSLDDEEFVMHDSEPVMINGTRTDTVKLDSFLYLKIDDVVLFFQAFKNLYSDYFASDTADKEVAANFPHPCRAIILGSSEGLRGVRIPNAVSFYGQWHDSGIWYNDEWEWWEGHNIRLTFEQVETIEISDQLARFEAKKTINKGNAEFENLIDKVQERNRMDEFYRVYNLLIRFGDNGYNMMAQNENPKAKESLRKSFLPYYQKAMQIGEGKFDTSLIEKKIADCTS